MCSEQDGTGLPCDSIQRWLANQLLRSERRSKSRGQTMEQPVEQGSMGVVFEVDLPAGPTELVTYLYNEKGKVGGAYFTEVEAL